MFLKNSAVIWQPDICCFDGLKKNKMFKGTSDSGRCQLTLYNIYDSHFWTRTFVFVTFGQTASVAETISFRLHWTWVPSISFCCLFALLSVLQNFNLFWISSVFSGFKITASKYIACHLMVHDSHVNFRLSCYTCNRFIYWYVLYIRHVWINKSLQRYTENILPLSFL